MKKITIKYFSAIAGALLYTTALFGSNSKADNNGSCPTITVTITSSTNELCYGLTNGSATASASGGATPYTYSWTSGNTGATANNLAAGTYTVTATDNNGCTGTAVVTIYQPAPLKIVSGNAFPASCYGNCNGAASMTLSGGTIPYAYSMCCAIGPYAWQATSLCAGNYPVTVTDYNGCTTDTTFLITSPTMLHDSTTGSQTICIGQSATLMEISSGGMPPYNYNWNTGATSSSIVVNPVITTTYTVSATDANGCAGVPWTVTVNVNPPIMLVTSASDTSICAGGSVNIQAIASGGDGTYIYVWQPGSITGQSISVLPASTTTYTVEATDACGTPANTDSVTVYVDAPTVENITYKDTIVSGMSDTITLSPSSGLSYIWSIGQTGNTIVVAPNVTTTYTVVVTNNGGCVTDTTVVVHVTPASVQNISGPSFDITCFPNPFSSSISVVFSANGKHYLEIDDITGRKLESIECSGTQYESNRNGLASGVYFIKAWDEGQNYVVTKKVVVQ